MNPAASYSRHAASFLLAVCGAALFVSLFLFRTLGPLDFWWWMGLNIALLCGLAVALDRRLLPTIQEDVRAGGIRKAALGLAAAAVLYGIFALGQAVSTRLLPFAASDIRSVYGLKAGAAPLRIALLLAAVIGPGEELFWRGTLQRLWSSRFGRWPGFLLATLLYTVVHIASGNAILVLAAAVGGLFWGLLYLRTNSVLLTAVSHTAWDLAVFILFPL